MDGVVCIKKEFFGTHIDTGIDNLKVWMLLRSLQSKGYLEVIFSWRHYYYTVNAEGISYIKGVLGVSDEDVQPLTRKIRKEYTDYENELAKETDKPQRGERGGLRSRPGFGRGKPEKKPQVSEAAAVENDSNN